MSRLPKTRPLDLGIDYTPRPRDANYQVIRTQPEFVLVRQERERNASSFFQAHAELVRITFTSAHDLTISDLRTIDPAIVMADTPDPHRYPKEYFIGVPKDRANAVIQQLKLKKEINSVNNEVTPQGMEYYSLGMTHYTVVDCTPKA